MKIVSFKNSVTYLRDQFSFVLYSSKENLKISFSSGLIDLEQKDLLFRDYLDREIYFKKIGNKFRAQRISNNAEFTIMNLVY